MASFQTKSIRFYSLLLVLLFFLPNFFTISQIHSDGQTSNQNLQSQDVNPDIQNPFFEPISDSQPRSGTENETEPNDDITSAVNNGNELHNGKEMRGEMRFNTDEMDYFYIQLTGGGQATIDRLNITPVFTDPVHIDNKSVVIRLKMYTEFDSEQFLLEYKLVS